MFKKLIGFTALAGIVAVGSGIGCSVTTTTTDSDAATTSTATNTTPTGTGTGVKPPAKDGAAASCYDDQSAITGFKFTAPKANQGVCTPAQIESIISSCFGAGGDATKCKAATDAAPRCDECITGKVDGPFPGFVTVDDQGNGLIAIPVCAGLVLNKPDCGPKVITAAACLSSACSTCETAGEEACETAAAADACKDALAAVGTCNTDLTAGAATSDPICRGADGLASLRKVAAYLCGGATSDAGTD